MQCSDSVAKLSPSEAWAAQMFHSRLGYRCSMMRRILARAVESTMPPLCVLGPEGD
jgi:hypothetical protein